LTQFYTAFIKLYFVHVLLFKNVFKGLFGIPELKSEDGFDILKNRALTEVDALIEEATNKDRKRKMVEIFDELSNTLCKVADMAEYIRVAHPDQRYVQAAEDACITISGVVEK